MSCGGYRIASAIYDFNNRWLDVFPAKVRDEDEAYDTFYQLLGLDCVPKPVYSDKAREMICNLHA